MNKLVKFKHFLFTVFFSFSLVSVVTAQESKISNKSIDSIVHSMFESINNRDYDALLNMMHPKIFEIAPKEQMLAIIQSMFQGNKQFSIDIPNEIPQYSITEITKNNEKNLEYVFLSYDMKMNMTFISQEFDEEMQEMMIPMLKAQGMEAEFISKNTIKVLMKDRVTIILKDEDTNNRWVMINYDPDSPLSYQVLDTEILEKAKIHRQELMLRSKKKEEN